MRSLLKQIRELARLGLPEHAGHAGACGANSGMLGKLGPRALQLVDCFD